MEIPIILSDETIQKIAKEVALINKEKSPLRQVIIPTDDQVLYSVAEVAKMSMQSKQTVARHINLKLLVATKPGRSWKIKKEDYLKYINNGNNE